MRHPDLTPCIKAEIDMEFTEHSFHDEYPHIQEPIGKLLRVESGSPGMGDDDCIYHSTAHGSFFACRPRMNHWHSWQGGECPLPDGYVVEVELRDKNILRTKKPGMLTWNHLPLDNGGMGDIIAFRIIGLTNSEDE